MKKDTKKNNIINFPNNTSKIERKVEAILFSASEPLDIETIEKRLNTKTNLIKILEKLQIDYKNRGINLVRKRDKWSFRTSEDLSKTMALQKSTFRKLSDLPTIDELSSAGMIDTSSIDSSIFGTGKFFKEQANLKNDNIYTEIDQTLEQTKKSDE